MAPSPRPKPKPKPLALDGRTLEGGGQLLRLAVSLSALTSLPIDITSIRANRAPRRASQPAGGLKAAHLAAVEWLARASQAETTGMEKGSPELEFRPLQRGEFLRETKKKKKKKKKKNDDDGGGEGAGVWRDVYDGSSLVRRETEIRLDSPGSVCLILQAILPYLLFHAPDDAAGSSSADADAGPGTTGSVPLRVVINGGTNVSKSPSIEYIDQVLIPMLVEKVGVPPITSQIIKRGWSSGRADVGAVRFDLTALRSKRRLSEFHFMDRGDVTRMHVSILASDSAARNTLKKLVIEKLLARHPDVEIVFPIEEDTKNGARLYLLIVAETSNSYRLGRDCLWERKSNASMLETVAHTVTKQLEEELQRGGCVDEYMQDQLVVFQALAEGRSVVDSGKDMYATLHTRTARWVAEQLLGLTFDERGTCGGCGFEVGEDFLAKKKTEREVEDSTEEFERLEIA
ncbi:MAG: hypothetical protein L6R36_008529 [Xanthoria steineri]|nr:MAG: hypothetical protein L6R36_008529 [Xanthoria steineri]